MGNANRILGQDRVITQVFLEISNSDPPASELSQPDSITLRHPNVGRYDAISEYLKYQTIRTKPLLLSGYTSVGILDINDVYCEQRSTKRGLNGIWTRFVINPKTQQTIGYVDLDQDPEHTQLRRITIFLRSDTTVAGRLYRTCIASCCLNWTTWRVCASRTHVSRI